MPRTKSNNKPIEKIEKNVEVKNFPTLEMAKSNLKTHNDSGYIWYTASDGTNFQASSHAIAVLWELHLMQERFLEANI